MYSISGLLASNCISDNDVGKQSSNVTVKFGRVAELCIVNYASLTAPSPNCL